MLLWQVYASGVYFKEDVYFANSYFFCLLVKINSLTISNEDIEMVNRMFEILIKMKRE